VPADVAKYFFLMRHQSSHLDFDLELARKTSEENPVYYVKYAHARICSIVAKAEAAGLQLAVPEWDEKNAAGAGALALDAAPLERLVTPEELALIRQLVDFPGFVSRAAEAREPHRLTAFSEELARSFHRFYHGPKVIQEDRELGLARLALCHATRRVLSAALGLMSVEAPRAM
jgi:arginyl-tRNA synthetase